MFYFSSCLFLERIDESISDGNLNRGCLVMCFHFTDLCFYREFTCHTAKRVSFIRAQHQERDLSILHFHQLSPFTSLYTSTITIKMNDPSQGIQRELVSFNSTYFRNQLLTSASASPRSSPFNLSISTSSSSTRRQSRRMASRCAKDHSRSGPFLLDIP